jgi:hypothetical protein
MPKMPNAAKNTTTSEGRLMAISVIDMMQVWLLVVGC